MDKFNGPVTPAEISSHLAALIEQLVPGGSPIYVDVRPVADASVNECFPLVEKQVQKHGGRLLVGWALWELPGLFVEAEFHGVWEQTNGALLDVAPKQKPTQRVLFLHDSQQSYQNRQVNNVRRAVRPLPVLDAYFQLLRGR